MNENESIQFDEEYIDEVVNRFKRSLVSGRKTYFDVSEFECIVEQLLEEGDLQASEIAVMQGMQIHPNALPLHMKYAQVLLSKEKYEDAIQCLNIIERIEPTNPDVHFIKGSAWLSMDRRTDALKAFGNAIKYAGTELDSILYHIGLSFLQSGDCLRAIQYFERVLRINPEDEITLCELGFLYDQMGNFSKSIEYYNRLIDIDPYNSSSWFNLGITHNKAENYDEAVKAYEFALVTNEKFHQALLNIANVFANKGEYNKAIEKYNEYLKLVPNDDHALCYIGECYLSLENYVKAKKYYHKAIELNAANDAALFGIGVVMWEERQYQDSITFISKAIEIDGANSEYWHTLAKVYSDFNRKTDAVKAIKQAVKLELDNSEIWLTWVDIYLQFKETESAVKILKIAIKKNNDVILKYRLVGLLLENERNEEAFEMLDMAMKQDFIKVNQIFEFCPKASKNRKLKKRISEFQRNTVHGKQL